MDLSKDPPPPPSRKTTFLKGVIQLVLFVQASVKEIARLGKNYPWPKPLFCPCCGGGLWWHGFIEAYFSRFPHCLYLRRLYCPHCCSVHRLRPAGFWRRFRSSIEEVRSAVMWRAEKKRWRPDLPCSRQRMWWRRLRRMIRMLLGFWFSGSICQGFDLLAGQGIIPVTTAKLHKNRVNVQLPYRIVALPSLLQGC